MSALDVSYIFNFDLLYESASFLVGKISAGMEEFSSESKPSVARTSHTQNVSLMIGWVAARDVFSCDML